MSWEATILTFALVDNVILGRLLGLDPGTPPAGLKSAAVNGGLVTLLMAAAALGGWALDSQVLGPLGFTVLRTPVFVLLVAGLAFGLQAVLSRAFGAVGLTSGFSVRRAAVNTAVLGVVLLTTRGELGAGRSLLAGAAAGAGFFLVSSMMSAIRMRLEVEPVPGALRGFPLQLITAGLMAYAFLAFDRSFLARFLGQ